MDKDNQSEHSKRDLPNTPRVCEKTLDYYQKFGHERELEKFMRLHSPASSQDSDKNQVDDCISTKAFICKRTKSRDPIPSNDNCEILAMMPSRPLNVCSESNSKSLPNIDIQGQVRDTDFYAASNEVTVDINIEADGEKEKILSISTENLKTPKKSFRSTKTQTPESVAKTHRRLEWDSLGDVGYKKSMSTSNVSIIERSLLREFFKEKSVVSEPCAEVRKKARNVEVKQSKTVEKFKVNEKEHDTPPLASSTLVNPTEHGAKPKMLSHSTSSTSLAEKFEKYAQTSFIKPPTVRSQEVQCTLSSAYSVVEGTATPSSFEYYSSRSSNSKSSKSSDIILNANARNRLQPQEHPFIASITDLLMKRKTLGEKTKQNHHQLNNIKDLQAKFQAALDENKENQIHAKVDYSSDTPLSLSKQAPELDLGIQLICALIDAKSINGKQKKQLIRDIIKRLTRIESEGKTEISTTTNNSEGTVNSSGGRTTNSSNLHRPNVYDSVHSNNSNNNKQPRPNPIESLELGLSSLRTEQMNTKRKSTASSTNLREGYNEVLAADQLQKEAALSRPGKIRESCVGQQHHQQQQQQNKHHAPKNTKLATCGTSATAAAAKINKETQSDLIMMEKNTYERKQMEISGSKSTADAIDKNCSKSNRCTQTSLTSASTASTTTTTTTTPDATTQKLKVKANPELNNSNNTDAEQPTMREWLNPLTQSEIEYEEKKQLELKKKAAAAQQEKLMKKVKHDCGRVQQLSWIENEIKRLECLRHLLLKDDTATSSSASASSINNSLNKNSTKNSCQKEDKLYDTVCTDKSSVLSESAEQLVQEIEIILEESHEDIINFKDNSKHIKERKKETQIIYETEKNSVPKCQTKPKLRIINEDVTIHKEQLSKPKQSEMENKTQKQREKIDTPTTDISKESDTFKDMVQQRKREFMEAYKTKKQHHYDALKQQQKDDFKYLNLAQKLSEKSPTTTDSEHYSLPHTMPRKYLTNSIPYYAHHITSMAPTEKGTKHKYASQQPSSQQQNLNKGTITSKSAEADNSTTNSSSSMFCMSSEISVPMGSQNTSSSPTSAHLCNGKATAAGKTGVAVQTTDSIRLSKPIYGPAAAPPLHPSLIHHNPTPFSSTACIQVKPKGIAYVIEFDDNKRTVSNQTSNTDTNSNDMLAKSKHSLSNTPATTNNLKSCLFNEQLPTLQEHLAIRKPKFLKHSKERKAILKQLQTMRQERVRQLREIIDNTSLNSLDRRLKYLPPPPIQKIRIQRTKDMKALTNKRFSSLPEVVAKHEREIEEKRRRSNRILRDVFNKRLQKRVRSGKLSLNHSKTIV